jgi:phosphocarrier protein HPr
VIRVDEGRRSVEIVNERGLHARASAKFVKLAATFDAEVTVSRDGQTVDARSIMGLMMLAAGPGCDIEISAEGPRRPRPPSTLEQTPLVELVAIRIMIG